jgi:transcriptional regulator GlxA family with amidase domain
MATARSRWLMAWCSRVSSGLDIARSVEHGLTRFDEMVSPRSEGAMTAALQSYHARMRRVLDHIDQHVDGDLDLDALNSVAAFSKLHFHRQFTTTFGLSLHRYSSSSA